ncbi:hypothetical protein N7522_007551 [Penicillium canescens]|nr:hypothetical protein N7522_007551 [Penicillium canescens]
MPHSIAAEITDVILKHDILGLTARSLMFSPKFSALVKQRSTSALRQIHDTLHVEDRITALIRKQRLLHYPKGTDIAGVYREFLFDQAKEVDEQWIRDVYFFDEQRQHFLVICCTYAQAKLFQSVRYIEMDLAFKMVAGKTNVFTIASWNEEGNRINTYAYAFMNLDTRRAYATLFERLFKVLGDVGRKPVSWAYQLGGDDDAEGIRTVTLDMCKKQAPGLGDYLASRDPRWNWHEHLERVLLFCEVHVKRAFFKKFPRHPAFGVITMIFQSTSKDEVIRCMDKASEEFPETANWFKNKRASWILAGITCEASKIPIDWWIAAPHHTGICESSHFVDNEAIGRKQSLLTAVLKTKQHVFEMVEKNNRFAETGQNATWRASDSISRISKQYRRKEPQTSHLDNLYQEEIKLQQEIAELQARKRLQDLKRQKEELLKQL